MHKVNKKILAVFLLASFAQKLSIGLYLHNWLHENKTYVMSDGRFLAFDKYRMKCTCIDDALMPLIAPAGIDGIKSPRIYSSFLLNYDRPLIIFVAKSFHGLRGPPILTL